jgi:ferredoxin
MPIPTSRTNENALITVDRDKCNGCGLCVRVCGDLSLEMYDGKARAGDSPMFGCMACGHCMAICPTGAIEISGRCLSPGDIFRLPGKEETTAYEPLLKLLQRRRSIRHFKDTPVASDVINKVLEAVRTAPMGLPPSDVNILVLDSREKVRKFAEDYCRVLSGMKWFFSSGFLAVMRPFWGRQTDVLFRNFLKPLVEKYLSAMKKGENVVTYDAPVMMYFYATPYADPADPVIAATYAMIAAESLGLGTCMLGAIHPFIQKGKEAGRFRNKYGIRFKSREGLMLIMGYPKYKFTHGITRSFASVDTFGN